MSQDGHIRIISGKFKGRKIPVINEIGLRPTTDRVKETLFNWLMFKIKDANVLDLFTGSGSLGLECISRYANKVTMIDLNKNAINNINNIINNLKITNAITLNTNAIKFLENTNDIYNIIFIDPPFRKGIIPQIIPLLTEKIVPLGSLIYIEHESELSLALPEKFKLLKEIKAGQVISKLFQIT